MYSWQVTAPIQRDLDRIEQLRGQLDRGTLPRRWAGRLRRDLEAESTAASTSMEGVPVTVDEVRRILAGDKPSNIADQDAKLVQGYRDAMSYVLRRADDPGFTWQAELILSIHDRVLAGSYADGAGRYRTSQVFVAAPNRQAVYEPPPPDGVPQLVEDLARFVEVRSADVTAPVMAALVHVRIAGIHPFTDGNGRTARVLASLAMYRGGYTKPEFTSLEEWWGAHRADYYAAFASLGEHWNPEADVTAFVEAHVGAQRLQVDALSLRESTERQLWTVLEDVVTEDYGLPSRLADALFDGFFGRDITNRYYRGLADVSVATATNDLARLEASGLLEGKGAGRSRAYSGSAALIAAVARAANLGATPTDTPVADQREWVIARLAKQLGNS